MPLTLSLLNYGDPPPAQLSVTFDERGGTIGRNPDNDWVIPDGHKQISRTHATIEHRMGGYYIVDGSSNGIFRNEENTRLPAGQPVQLNDGDRLMFGNFQVRANITESQPNTFPGFGDPGNDPYSGVLNQPNEFSADGRHLDLEEDSMDGPNPFAGAFGPASPSTPPDAAGLMSPPAMPDVLDLAGGPEPGLPGMLGSEPQAPPPAVHPAEAQHTPAHREVFDPPRRRASPTAETEQPGESQGEVRAPVAGRLVPELPTEWKVRADGPTDDSDDAFDLPDPLPEPSPPDAVAVAPARRTDPFHDAMEPEAPVLRPQQPPPAPQQPPLAQTPQAQPAPIQPAPIQPAPIQPAPPSSPAATPPAEAAGNLSTPIDEDFLDIFAEPAHAPAREAPPPPPALAPPAAAAAAPAPAAAYETGRAPVTGGVGHEQAVQALLRGMGLDATQFDTLSSPENLETLGKVLREAVRGTREVLMVRAKIRNEFRVQGTMLRPSENNPLKFSVSIEDALKRLLQPSSGGFLGPIDSLREAFRDLAGHEMATLTGMRAGLHDVLTRFEPEKLEQRLNSDGLLNNLLPSNRKAQLWDMFCEHYRTILAEAENDFEELFGRQFAQAYERELRHLRETGAGNAGQS